MVGLGDARALHELTAHLSDLGADVEVAYANTQLAGKTKNNIILLGGEEANSLVDYPFGEAIASSLTFQTPPPPLILRDELRNETYEAEWRDVGSGKEIKTDYGILIRARIHTRQNACW